MGRGNFWGIVTLYATTILMLHTYRTQKDAAAQELEAERLRNSNEVARLLELLTTAHKDVPKVNTGQVLTKEQRQKLLIGALEDEDEIQGTEFQNQNSRHAFATNLNSFTGLHGAELDGALEKIIAEKLPPQTARRS